MELESHRLQPYLLLVKGCGTSLSLNCMIYIAMLSSLQGRDGGEGLESLLQE